MKKLVFICIFLLSFYLTAEKVELADIQTNQALISQKIQTDFDLPQPIAIDFNKTFPLVQDGVTVAWIANLSPEGWVMLSSATEEYPVLMFSEEGEFHEESLDENCVFNDLDEEPAEEDFCDPLMAQYFAAKKRKLLIRLYLYNNSYIPDPILSGIEWFNPEDYSGVNIDLSAVSMSIRAWSEMQILSPSYINYLTLDNEISGVSEKKVLEGTGNNKWFQYYSYNNKFPSCKYSPAEQVVVGCTALSHAQALRLWKYPDKYTSTNASTSYNGTTYYPPKDDSDSQFYNWSNMSLDDRYSASGDTQRFLFDVSASILDMDWGCYSSSAAIKNGKNTMIKNFGYSKEMKNFDHLPIESYMNLMKNQIDSGFPVILSINNPNHAILGLGYMKASDGEKSFWMVRVNMGWITTHLTWRTVLDDFGIYPDFISLTEIDGININFYPEYFCGFENKIDEDNFDGNYDLSCDEPSPASINADGEYTAFGDLIGLYYDNCPAIFNPGQFVKYWCLDMNKDSICDSIKKEDVIREDCAEDTYFTLMNRSESDIIDKINFGFKKHIKVVENGQTKTYSLYKIYEQLYDKTKVLSEYDEDDFLNEDGSWRDGVCTAYSRELDSDEFLNDCIEGDGIHPPSCDNQCEFTYGITINDESHDCPVCFTQIDWVVKALNPEESSSDLSWVYHWKNTTEFKMCEDVDGDRVCDKEFERYTCGNNESDPYAWGKVCANPRQFIVRPADDESQPEDIFYYKDNCPDVANPMVLAPIDSELISGKCQYYFDENVGLCAYPSDGGARFNTELQKSGYEKVNSYGYLHYYWQPDHDLDGKGDACDPDYKYTEISSSLSYENTGLIRRTSSQAATISYYGTLLGSYIDFENTVLGAAEGKKYFPLSISLSEFQGFEDLLYGDLTAPELMGVEAIENMYCWMTPAQYNDNNWGTDGNCTDSNPQNDGIDQFIGDSVSYGYSHGSDPKPVSPTGSQAWNSVLPNQSDSPKSDSSHKRWNWKEVYLDKYGPDSYNNVIKPVLDGESGTDENGKALPIMKYTMSSGVIDELVSYLKDDGNGGKTQNPAHFLNDRIYARSYRETNQAEDIKLYRSQSVLVEIHDSNIILPVSGEEVFRETCPFCLPPDIHIDLINIWDYSYDYGMITTTGRHLAAPQNEHSFFMENHGLLTAGITDPDNQNIVSVMMSYPGSNDWHELFEIDAAQIQSFDTVIDLNGLHFVSGNTFYKAVEPQGPATALYTVEAVADLPVGMESPHLEKINNVLYLFGTDSSDSLLKAYKLAGFEYQQPHFEEIATQSYPYAGNYRNMTVIDNTLYLAGGGDFNEDTKEISTDGKVWKFNPESGFELITEIADPSKDLLSVALFIDDGKLLIVPKMGVKDGVVKKYAVDIESGSVEQSDTYIAGWKDSFDIFTEYCLVTENGSLFAGTYNGGICRPFTHKWYRSFPAGNTVYSVAGKGDRLYVGTDSHITVYNISDPAAMTYVTEYSVSGERVYDLEVAESEMYAATSGGIYRFDVSDSDTLTLISSYDTGYNYQYKIQLYNDLLYVGDDYGINIRDKETFALISYVDDGAILDFSISEGEIALYSSAFLSSTIQIRDAASLNLKAWEYADCYTGELTSDQGEFYLSCDGYEYRFEGRPDTYIDFYSIEGDMYEMQENYVNNGWVYFPYDNNVKLSTNNDVPSLCGNGIIESGELCDNNSVACTSIDPDYYGGTAYCNSTCDGYNEDNCEEDDGW